MSRQNRNMRRTSRTPNLLRETQSIISERKQDQSVYTRRLTFQGTGTTNGAGQLVTVLSMDPSGSSDWASVSALYDEFRVLGIKIKIHGCLTNTITAGANAIAVVYDNDDSTALASYSAALEYITCKSFESLWGDNSTPQFLWARPQTGQLSPLWCDIGAPATSVGAVKFYADGLTVSTKYYTIFVEWAIEFRGQR